MFDTSQALRRPPAALCYEASVVFFFLRLCQLNFCYVDSFTHIWTLLLIKVLSPSASLPGQISCPILPFFLPPYQDEVANPLISCAKYYHVFLLFSLFTSHLESITRRIHDKNSVTLVYTPGRCLKKNILENHFA